MAGPRGRLVLQLLGIAGALVVLLFSAHALWKPVAPILSNRSVGARSDFAWYYTAFRSIWDGLAPTVTMYNVPFEDQFMRFLGIGYDHLDLYSYPPMFALLFSPFAKLNYVQSRQWWSYFTMGAYLVALIPTVLLACPEPRPARRLLLASLGFWAFPLLNNFSLGQSDTLTLLCIAAGLWLIYARRAEIAGGAMLGLGAMLKVTPAITLPYLLLRGRWRAAAGGFGFVAVGCVVAGLGLSWRTLVNYVKVVLPAVEASAYAHGPAPWNQSFRGMLMRYLHRPPTALTHLDHLFVAVLFGALVLLFWLRPGIDVRLEAAVIALLPLFGSPSLETHHFVLTILPEILLGGYLVDHLSQFVSWPMWLPYVVSVVFLAVPNYKFGPDVGMYLFGPKGVGYLPLKTGLENLISNGQHFWCICLLLFIAVLAALGMRPNPAKAG